MANYNPYAAPQAVPPMPAGPQYPGGGGPQPWEIGEVLGHAWNMFKPSWAVLVFSLFLGGIISGVPGYIPVIALQTGAVEPNSAEYWSIYSVCTFIGFIVGTFFFVGWAKIWLAAARGATPSFGDLFSGSGFFSMLAARFLKGLAIGFGMLLLFVPGIYLACALAFTELFIVDKKMGPIEAMGASWKATEGQRLNLFLYGLVALLIVFAGLLACGCGAYVAAPVVGVAWATIFLRVTGGMGGPSFGPPGGYAPPGYGAPPAGGFGAPPGGGYAPPGGGYGGPPGGYGGPPGGPGY